MNLDRVTITGADEERDRLASIRADLEVPYADVNATHGEPHTSIGHWQSECPHPACRYHSAVLRLGGHVRWLLARLDTLRGAHEPLNLPANREGAIARAIAADDSACSVNNLPDTLRGAPGGEGAAPAAGSREPMDALLPYIFAANFALTVPEFRNVYPALARLEAAREKLATIPGYEWVAPASAVSAAPESLRGIDPGFTSHNENESAPEGAVARVVRAAAGGPDSAIDAEIDRALADVSVIANHNTDQAHGFRVGYRAALRRGESLIAWVRERCAVAAQEAYMPGTDPHGEWRRACRNAAAAILALEFGPSTVNNTKPLDSPPVCGGCGGPHHFDTTVPSPTWNRVIRAAGLSDYLCTTCIVRAFVAAGEGFTAELWGEDFNGVPIELRVRSLEAQTAADLGNENTALRARGSAADAAISDLAHAAGRHQADCSTCRQAMKRNADAIDRVLKPLPAPQAAE